MAGIHSKNTKPETIIRKGLHAKGFRYSMHSKGVPGKPDIVMPRWHVVIFVNGCFWHRHGCYLSKMPKTNTAFWESKLAANKRRDVLVKQQLAATGWRTATVWECATRGKSIVEYFPYLIEKLTDWIRNKPESPTLEIAASDLQASFRPSDDTSTTV